MADLASAEATTDLCGRRAGIRARFWEPAAGGSRNCVSPWPGAESYSMPMMWKLVFNALEVQMEFDVQSVWVCAGWCCMLYVGCRLLAYAHFCAHVPSRMLSTLVQCMCTVDCHKCCLVIVHDADACEERSGGGLHVRARLVACVHAVGRLIMLPDCMWQHCMEMSWAWHMICCLCLRKCWSCCWSCWSCCLWWCCWRENLLSRRALRCCWSGRPPGTVCA